MTWIYVSSVVLATVLLFWLPTQIRYRITRSHFLITLFGLPLRRVKLINIEQVTKRHSRWAEHWWNTWRPFRRRMMICRNCGIMKNLVITPKYRYEFRAELEQAIRHAKELPEHSAVRPQPKALKR